MGVRRRAALSVLPYLSMPFPVALDLVMAGAGEKKLWFG